MKSDFAGEHGELETEQGPCKPVCRGMLQLTPCSWEQCLKLQYHADDRYNLLDGSVVSRASMVEDNEHTKINGGFCSLVRRVCVDGRRVKNLHEQSLKMRLRDAAMLLEGSEDQRGDVRRPVGRLL